MKWLVLLVLSQTALAYDFEGIIKLRGCSGSLIQFEGQSVDAAAVIMTNGHCVDDDLIEPNSVIVNKTDSRKVQLFKSLTKKFSLETTRILYATMTGTDIAFFELKETYAQIEARYQVRPFEFSNSHPSLHESIDIISGYWEKGYSCNIEAFVARLKEGDWWFSDSIRYSSECITKGGTSGSPIIERGTRRVIAVNNSRNENGYRCTVNNPCELGAGDSVMVFKERGYGQQSYQVYTCLDRDFQFDLKLPGCLLAK
jgi:Trypsin-like peptidase domain